MRSDSEALCPIVITRNLERGLRGSPPPGITAEELVGFFDKSRLVIEESAESAILQSRNFQVEIRIDSHPYLICEVFSDFDEADIAGARACRILNAHFDSTSIRYWVVPSVLLHRSEDSWDREGAQSYWLEYRIDGIWITDGYCQSFSFVDAVRLEYSTLLGSSKSFVHGSFKRAGTPYHGPPHRVHFSRYYRYKLHGAARVYQLGQYTYDHRQGPTKLEQLRKVELVDGSPYSIYEHEGHFDQRDQWVDLATRKL